MLEVSHELPFKFCGNVYWRRNKIGIDEENIPFI